MNRTLRVSLRSQVREKIGVAGTFVICFSAGGGEELLLATCHSSTELRSRRVPREVFCLRFSR